MELLQQVKPRSAATIHLAELRRCQSRNPLKERAQMGSGREPHLVGNLAGTEVAIL